jgi:hypothetical protein
MARYVCDSESPQRTRHGVLRLHRGDYSVMLAVEVAKQDGLQARRQGMLERASVPSDATKHTTPQTVVIQMFLVRVAKNKKKQKTFSESLHASLL